MKPSKGESSVDSVHAVDSSSGQAARKEFRAVFFLAWLFITCGADLEEQ
jgi:hypothetical protein